MEELDLHNVKHEDVNKMVEDWLLLKTPPVRIITGNSHRMKHLVKEVLDKHSYKYYIDSWNLGCIRVVGY